MVNSPVLAQQSSATPPVVEFHYEDIDNFSTALAAVQAGTEPEAAFERYVESATPALRAFGARYNVTSTSISGQYARRPLFHQRLAHLRPRIEAEQADITRAVVALLALAPPEAAAHGAPPVYFIVGNQTAGGTPVLINRDGEPPRPGIALALESMSMGPDVDMSEFPTGPGGRAALADVRAIVVHETVHVLQARTQGFQNYLSIYDDEHPADNLAIAIREGCAEYLTWLASGWRLGDRHVYGAAHEQELWSAFRTVMHAPGFSAPGWFGGVDPERPDMPPQIGYWLGMRICEVYHQTAEDKDAAIRDMFAAYRPEDFQRIAAPYAARLGD
jgi:hypothetical protein